MSGLCRCVISSYYLTSLIVARLPTLEDPPWNHSRITWIGSLKKKKKSSLAEPNGKTKWTSNTTKPCRKIQGYLKHFRGFDVNNKEKCKFEREFNCRWYMQDSVYNMKNDTDGPSRATYTRDVDSRLNYFFPSFLPLSALPVRCFSLDSPSSSLSLACNPFCECKWRGAIFG